MDIFDRVRYDADGDVLYLHRADPSDAVEFDASPKGHALRFSAAGELIAVTIVNARWLLEHEGEVKITIPEQIHVPPALVGDFRRLRLLLSRPCARVRSATFRSPPPEAPIAERASAPERPNGLLRRQPDDSARWDAALESAITEPVVT
jgi:uncharacterized protein YuzE